MNDKEKNEEGLSQGCGRRFRGFGVEHRHILGVAGSLGEGVVNCLVDEAIERRCMGDDLPCFHRKVGQVCRMRKMIKG